MSKQETTFFKGIALMMMLWYHLFGLEDMDDLAHHIFFIEGHSLSNLMARACNPVFLFLILGGYGLYAVYQKGQDHHHVSRLVKLYKHHWMILLLVLPPVLLLNGRSYLGSWTNIVSNLIALDPTWNETLWFLLPYCLLSFSYPWLFKATDRLGFVASATITFALYIAASYMFSRHGNMVYHHGLVTLVNETAYLSFAFYLGAAIRKYNMLTHWLQHRMPLWMAVGGLVLAVAVRIGMNTRAIDPFYSCAIVLLTLQIKLPRPITRFGELIGRHSMNIWMIHDWLYNTFFTSFIYGFRYPIVIFVVLLTMSLAVSYAVNFLVRLIEPSSRPC